MVILDLAILVAGLAGLAASSVLFYRAYPGERVVGMPRPRPRGRVVAFQLFSFGVAVFGASLTQARVGKWFFSIPLALLLASTEVPRLLHNREVERATGKDSQQL